MFFIYTVYIIKMIVCHCLYAFQLWPTVHIQLELSLVHGKFTTVLC